jgi:YVTN family beta-propeller protein
MPNQGSSTVSVIDTTMDAVIATIPVGLVPDGVAVSPDGSRVYITLTSSNTVQVINTNRIDRRRLLLSEISPVNTIRITGKEPLDRQLGANGAVGGSNDHLGYSSHGSILLLGRPQEGSQLASDRCGRNRVFLPLAMSRR